MSKEGIQRYDRNTGSQQVGNESGNEGFAYGHEDGINKCPGATGSAGEEFNMYGSRQTIGSDLPDGEGGSRLVRNFDTKGPTPMGKAVEIGGVKQLMTCPYNESHRVGFGCFARHLINCRKAASAEKREEFIVCQYNASHHMHKSVYEDHLKICVDFREWQADHFELPDEVFGRRRQQITYYAGGNSPEKAPVKFVYSRNQSEEDLCSLDLSKLDQKLKKQEESIEEEDDEENKEEEEDSDDTMTEGLPGELSDDEISSREVDSSSVSDYED